MDAQVSPARQYTGFFAITQVQLHLAMWFYLFAMLLLSRLFAYPVDQWVARILGDNLIRMLAFLAIFHILTTTDNKATATGRDWLAMTTLLVITLGTGLVGTIYDIGAIIGLLAAYIYLARPEWRDASFLAVVYFALFLNGFAAPMLFQLFKPFFLLGEAQFAAAVINALGIAEVTTIDDLIQTANGMRLRMVGACSVFTNLSFAFLGYASVKAICRKPFGRHDILFVGALMMLLILGNSVRIGLMAIDFAHYEFWHHGQGASLFGTVQLAVILAISVLSVMWLRRI